jgi:Ca-activated chloride channel family protein
LPARRRGKEQSPHAQRSTATFPVAVAVALLTLLVLNRAAEASPAKALKEYSAGNFTNALTEYERLLNAQREQQKPEDPRLHFNAGTAAYRATNYPVALQHFASAATAPDLSMQAKAYYNLGNTQFRLGQAAETLDALEEAWKLAIKHYQNVLALDPTNADAQFNRSLVEAALEQIARLRELARQAKEAADEASRQRNYRAARAIMEQLLQNNIAAKPFEEFTQKLRQIDEIANPPAAQP